MHSDRRIAKRTGLLLCGLIFLAWVISFDRDIGYIARGYSVSLTSGAVCVVVAPNAQPAWYSRVRGGPLFWLPYYEWWHQPWGGPGWSRKANRSGTRANSPKWWIGGGKPMPSMHNVICPLSIPFLIVAVPTFILWRRDRPAKAGHYRCRHDVTGNVSGRCPECGAKA